MLRGPEVRPGGDPIRRSLFLLGLACAFMSLGSCSKKPDWKPDCETECNRFFRECTTAAGSDSTAKLVCYESRSACIHDCTVSPALMLAPMGFDSISMAMRNARDG